MRIRALVRLRSGQAEAGLQDVLTILRLAHHLQIEPGVPARMLRMAIVPQAFQPIWEGIQDHRWNLDQLVRLQAAIESLDLIAVLRTGVDQDRVVDELVWQRILRAQPWNKAWLLFPKGWVWQNQVRADKCYLEQWLPCMDPEHGDWVWINPMREEP